MLNDVQEGFQTRRDPSVCALLKVPTFMVQLLMPVRVQSILRHLISSPWLKVLHPFSLAICGGAFLCGFPPISQNTTVGFFRPSPVASGPREISLL